MLMNKLNWIRLKNRRARFIVATADLSARQGHTTMRFCSTLCPTSLVHPHYRVRDLSMHSLRKTNRQDQI